MGCAGVEVSAGITPHGLVFYNAPDPKFPTMTVNALYILVCKLACVKTIRKKNIM